MRRIEPPSLLITNIFFCTYYNLENKNIKIGVELNFKVMSFQQLISLISLVLSETVQDKYSFTTDKRLDTAPFLNCKSLEPTLSLALP